MIRRVRVKGKVRYRVLSESGKSMGTYDTRDEADERLAQVEMFKAMAKNKQPRRGKTLKRLVRTRTGTESP